MGGRGSGGGNWVPDAVKRARGTLRRDRARAKPEAYANYVRATPRMPKGLPQEERKVWREIVPKLAARGILCKLDQTGLAVLCCLTAHVASGNATRREISEWLRWRAEFGMSRRTWDKVPVLPLPEDEFPCPKRLVAHNRDGWR
jgi:hypothetical protein